MEILDLKSTVIEMKSSLEGLNNKSDLQKNKQT